MKIHIVVKLRQQLPDDVVLPDWQSFINDKSVVRESLNADFDRLMSELNLKYWVTKEYKPSAVEWSPEEISHGLNRTYRIIFQQDCVLPEHFLQRVASLPSVEDARQLEIGEATLPQPQLATQTSIERQSVQDLIYLSYAQALTKGSEQVKIAVLDTGVNLNHKELRGKIVKRADFVNLEGLDTTGFIGDFSGYDDVPEDEVGHGTHVSGIIAGRGIEMDEGVAPDCSIMAVRVLATMKQGARHVGAGIVDNINAGIKWAVDNGADVINMSLGIKHVGGGLPHEDVIRYALSKNVTVVAASGNDGTSERYYPGALPGVIAVGAVDNSGAVTRFTSYGANITVVAPGQNIYSSFANNTYALATGTSQASPFVAGSIGLAKSYALDNGKKLSNSEITYILRNTSDKVDSRLRNELAGYGLINLADAFKLLTYMLN
ncbi:MAG TPA: S8 family serine peptidase [Pyrinomonadaceae bacterium]|jgi:subtilisin family serine protease